MQNKIQGMTENDPYVKDASGWLFTQVAPSGLNFDNLPSVKEPRCGEGRKRGRKSVERREQAARSHYAYECKFPVRFAAGRHLFVTHSRPYTAADSMEHTRVGPVFAVARLDFQFLFLSLLARTRPPYIPFLHSFSLRISERSRRPCTLPQLSATVISFGYFCPRIASPLYIAAALPCCTFLLIMQP